MAIKISTSEINAIISRSLRRHLTVALNEPIEINIFLFVLFPPPNNQDICDENDLEVYRRALLACYPVNVINS